MLQLVRDCSVTHPRQLLSAVVLPLISFYRWTMPHPTPCHQDPRLSWVRTLANSSVLSLMAPSSLCLEVSQRCNLKTFKGKPSTIMPISKQVKTGRIWGRYSFNLRLFVTRKPCWPSDQSTLLSHASTQALFARFWMPPHNFLQHWTTCAKQADSAVWLRTVKRDVIGMWWNIEEALRYMQVQTFKGSPHNLSNTAGMWQIEDGIILDGQNRQESLR